MSIFCGIAAEAREFYESLGYTGRGTVLRKSLSGQNLAQPADARQERLAALRTARAQRLTSHG